MHMEITEEQKDTKHTVKPEWTNRGNQNIDINKEQIEKKRRNNEENNQNNIEQ